MKPIFTNLAPNVESDDVHLALKLLCSPRSWVKGDAPSRLAEKMKSFLPIRHAFSFESGRTSLLAILSCLNLHEGDEVLLQSFTCVAVPGPVFWAGAKPVYVDCDETLTMSVEDLRNKITPQSRVLILQHTFGQPARIHELMEIAKKHNFFVIEDCAHSLGSTYRGKQTGTFGDASIFSFGRDKVISSVFGGMVVTNDDALAKKLQAYENYCPFPGSAWVFQQLLHPLILSFAKRTYHFFSLGKIVLECAKRIGLISKAVYSTEKHGGKPGFIGKRLPNALALLALHQFEKLQRFSDHRRELVHFYKEHLGAFPKIPETDCAPLRFSFKSSYAAEIFEEGKKERIYFGDWYTTAIAPEGVSYECIEYDPAVCPNAERIAREIFNLPTDIHITLEDAQRIIDFLNRRSVSRGTFFTIRMIESKKVWRDFLLSAEPNTFLQSWEWGEFHKATATPIFPLGIFQGEKLLALALILKIGAKRGSFLFCPHGPIFSKESFHKKEAILKALKAFLIEQAKQEKCAFFRFSPLFAENPEHQALFRRLGFREAPTHMHPELAWILDITPDEATLLKNMRKTTRYLIRKAEKDGVQIIVSDQAADIEKFWNVYEATVQRQHFTPFSKEYLRKEFEIFSNTHERSGAELSSPAKRDATEDKALFFFASYRDEILSTAMIIFSKYSAFYHHGASLQTHPNIPASYLLQWHAIQEAKRRGCKKYNFWGIAPEAKKHHPWAGLSLFKKGFGGYAEIYAHAKDFVLSPKYWITYFIEEMRRMKRGL